MMTLDNFYRSKEWERLRAQLQLERINSDGDLICARCGKPITKAYDCIAHHRIELTDDNVNDFEISLNPENIDLIHFRCHNEIHERYGGSRRRVFLVYGPPCAGKTSWVRKVARPDDLILDMDSIWEAVCISDREHKPNRLKANVFGIRDCIIEQIKIRTGNWRSAYVIGGYALASDRRRMVDLLGAEEVFIDTPIEECLARAGSEQWKTYIHDWFDAFGNCFS